MRIIRKPEIAAALSNINIQELVLNQEDAFAAYSQGNAIVPPVGHMEFLKPPGECHIKYGYIRDTDVFVIKVASGFYDNSINGLPAGDGLLLIFSQKTGILEAILLDEGHLTNVRTAVAGLIAAKYLAPKRVYGIGIFGTGCQAKLQLEYLKIGLKPLDCKNVWVWGRSMDKLNSYRQESETLGLNIQLTTDAEAIVKNCNLIITTTAAKQALFNADLVRPGTHITAIGTDSPGKQELDPQVFKYADICVVDSMRQCGEYGDVSYAIKEPIIPEDKLVELGKLISNPKLGRKNDQQITVADLTGIAVQDIKIAMLINNRLKESSETIYSS